MYGVFELSMKQIVGVRHVRVPYVVYCACADTVDYAYGEVTTVLHHLRDKATEIHQT